MKILDFYADWCQPCKAMIPVIESLEKKYPSVKVQKINVDKEPRVAEKYNVMSIPTYIFLDDKGKEAGRKVGNVAKEVLEKYLK